MKSFVGQIFKIYIKIKEWTKILLEMLQVAVTVATSQQLNNMRNNTYHQPYQHTYLDYCLYWVHPIKNDTSPHGSSSASLNSKPINMEPKKKKELLMPYERNCSCSQK